MICFICQKNHFKKIYSLETKNILICRNCGLFVAQKTGKDKIYGKEYFSNRPNLNNRNYFLNKLRTINQLTNNNEPYLLNVGCGWGDFEEVLEQPHFAKASRGREKIPYLGIDINKEAIEICKKKGLNCKKMTINQLTMNHEHVFDAITLFQVIEHLKDPIPLLKSAKKHLKPKGVILITTPNNDSPLRKIMRSKWSVYTEPSHFIFYNKKTLTRIFELAGFKNINVKIDTIRLLSLRYILSRLKLQPTTYNLIPDLPILTDPFGDLEAVAY